MPKRLALSPRPAFDPAVNAVDTFATPSGTYTLCVTTSPGIEGIDVVGTVVTVRVAEGTVYRLGMRPVVAKLERGKFHDKLAGRLDPSDTFNPASPGAIHMLVEVATGWQADLTKLRLAVRGAVTHDKPSLLKPEDNALRLRFTPPKGTETLVTRVDLHLQRWRWDGRPVYATGEPGQANQKKVDERSVDDLQWTCAFPFGPGNGTVPADGKYDPVNPSDDGRTLPDRRDGMLFGQRRDEDYFNIASDVDYIARSVEDPANWASENLVHNQSLLNLPGALYYRVGATITTRYAPLQRGIDNPSTIRGMERTVLASEDVKNERLVPGWYRFVIPARWNQRLPRPAIKLVVPLTAARDPSPFAKPQTGKSAAELNPGFLVVLEDRWYSDSLGGLAERLTSEIVRVADPNDGPGASDARFPQFGPDPIVTAPTSSSDPRAVKLPPPVGAFGYTFDTDTEAPLFVHSSFLQPPPVVATKDGEAAPDLSWHFVQMRFRRELDPAGVLPEIRGTPPSTKSNDAPGHDPVDVVLRSAWSDPIWAQVLPPSNRLPVKRIDNGEQRVASSDELRFDPATGELHLIAEDGAHPVDPVPTHPRRFVWAALVTEAVSDAFGRSDREKYRGLVAWSQRDQRTALLTIANARVRLLELQHLPDVAPTDEKTIFDGLFPQPAAAPSGAAEPTARIVRVSSLIERAGV
ncbi:MAG: hypothetical protein QM770_04655 [Tepidisphaeraceae bacterium]